MSIKKLSIVPPEDEGTNRPSAEEVRVEEPEAVQEAHSDDPKRPSLSPWHEFLKETPEPGIHKRIRDTLRSIIAQHSPALSRYCCLGILDTEANIATYELDKTFGALLRLNPARQKDILLILWSLGGNIEPAYQIAKICKTFAKEKFIVLVPRQAKSAVTLIALGADEIHIGPLGQLGPIDPQLGGLPALGVSQALRSIASLAQEFPGSSDMFARYLRMALTVEQIGYSERICESAEQYAERLLLSKPHLQQRAHTIANQLVREYKDQGFVIDLDEARKHLGDDWVFTATPELAVAEQIYDLIDHVNLWLSIHNRGKRIVIIGNLEDDVLMLDRTAGGP